MNLLHLVAVWWRARRIARYRAWRRRLSRMFVGATPAPDQRNWSGEYMRGFDAKRTR
jgi:hypothetical protein